MPFYLAIHPEVRGPELLYLAFWDNDSQNAIFIPESRLLEGSHIHDGVALIEPRSFVTRLVPRAIALKLRLRCILIEVDETRRIGDGRLLNFIRTLGSIDEETPNKLTEFIEPQVSRQHL